MLELTNLQQQHIKLDATSNPDREVCGLILNNGSIVSCQNIHPTPLTDFHIATSEYVKYEPIASAIYHSHVNDNSQFTAADVDLVYSADKPLVLYSLILDRFKIADLSYDRPLIDCEFLYGIDDCYSIVERYYYQQLGVKLSRYPRSGDTKKWDEEDWDLIDRSFEAEGFEVVNEDPIEHDLLAMSLGNGNRAINHLAVYVGNNTFIHQLCNKKSRYETWGHPWREYTIKVLRHGG